MRLIGMLDSPYVRRVAVSLDLMGLTFAHEPLSVFRHFDAFAAINPIVKAPTLVLPDGTVLIDSTLILEHAERIADPGRSLTPADLGAHARGQRIIGIALAACEKAVQIVYERELRPPEKQHGPWIERVAGQLAAALGLLEAALPESSGWIGGERVTQADVTAAIAWRFTGEKLPDLIDPAERPRLAAHSRRAEALPSFAAWPYTE